MNQQIKAVISSPGKNYLQKRSSFSLPWQYITAESLMLTHIFLIVVRYKTLNTFKMRRSPFFVDLISLELHNLEVSQF